MRELPQEEGERLLWHIGRHDPRKDRGIQSLGLFVVFTIIIMLQFIVGVSIYPHTNEGGKVAIIYIVLGMWLIMLLGLAILTVYRRVIRFDVLTQVPIAPDEASDRLERVLKNGVKALRVETRSPELHEEVKRFHVVMGWKKEATLVVHCIDQPHDGPTDIRVRSKVNNDDWRDLRGLVEDAFRDLPGIKVKKLRSGTGAEP